MKHQGHPIWYELGTSDPAGAGAFYAGIFGWSVSDSGMEGFDYRLASIGGDMVAGIMAQAEVAGGAPPNWLIYFGADDCDASAAAVVKAGGRLLMGPQDIPGTGRYAVVQDPQGAVFGLLTPDMSQMSPEAIAKAEAGSGAFDQQKPGHGNWNELMTTDPAAALALYGGWFGWAKGDAMDMGEMGSYQLIRHRGADIGAIMGLGNSPVPCWLPYFGIDGTVSASCDKIVAGGGTVHHGPVEVPGPAWIAIAQDPQGAWFAMVGTQK